MKRLKKELILAKQTVLNDGGVNHRIPDEKVFNYKHS